MTTLTQRGSSHIIIGLALVVLSVVGLAGYRVMHTSDNMVSSNVPSRSSEPTVIRSTADVKKASAALKDTAIDGTVNPAQLDSDLNSLL